MTDQEVENKIKELWDAAPETLKAINNICNPREGVLSPRELQYACIRTAVFISGLYQKAAKAVMIGADDRLDTLRARKEDAYDKCNPVKIAVTQAAIDAYEDMKKMVKTLNITL